MGREFLTVEYQDRRYRNETNEQPSEIGAHEWSRTFKDLKPILAKYLPQPRENPRILHLGCGTSTLTAYLHAIGYYNQTNVDFSAVAIEEMKVKHHAIRYETKCCPYKDESFLPSGPIPVSMIS